MRVACVVFLLGDSWLCGARGGVESTTFGDLEWFRRNLMGFCRNQYVRWWMCGVVFVGSGGDGELVGV